MTKQDDIKSLFEGIVGYIPETTEDELHKGMEYAECPYGECDGSHYILVEKDGHTYTKWCRCYEEEVLQRKLKRAGIESKYWEAGFEAEGAKATLLHPKKKPDERKIDKRKTKVDVEEPDAYIDRNYERMPIKKGVAFFAQEFTNKTLQFLDEEKRNRSKSALLMGEPGTGKTYLACAIGKAYIEAGKTVHFTTMLKLVADVMNKDIDIRSIVSKTDLLIVDELGYEYHTDTQWALKQIKELLRMRYNAHLPVICTSNFYPNELAELYDGSLMSMFHGSYFMTLMEREVDARVEEARRSLDDFSFTGE